jgi:hypothetical protein
MTKKKTKKKAVKAKKTKRSKAKKKPSSKKQITAPQEIPATSHDPNVHVEIHDATGSVSVSYWDDDVKSVKDVVDRMPAVLTGFTNIAADALNAIIRLIGKEVAATISYSQGGYGPANAVEDVTLRVDMIRVIRDIDHNGGDSKIEFMFTIVP